MLGRDLNEFSKRAPDFASSQYGVSIWTNEGKNGKPYLTIRIPLLGLSIPCFKIEGKQEVPVVEK